MTPLPPISVSINPSYYCNLRCEFCYLTPEQLADKTRLSLDRIQARLEELRARYRIERVDLYGGEVFMLPQTYVSELLDRLTDLGIEQTSIITNLTTHHKALEDPRYHLTVSYDGKARERHKDVLEALRALQRPFSILTLISPQFDALTDPVEFMMELNSLEHLVSLEFKPYSENQANQHGASYRLFERWVQQFIQSPIGRNYEFVNASLIRSSLDRSRNAFSNDHVYLTPTGQWGVLEFDSQDREYFLPLADLDALAAWSLEEQQRVKANPYCGSCEYVGHCLSEHIREVRDMNEGCNGFKDLLDWSKSIEELKPIAVQIQRPSDSDPAWKWSMYHHHFKVTHHSDDLRFIEVVEATPQWAHIEEYLTQRLPRLIYPAKSIAVSCIYAWMLHAHYGTDIIETLKDPNLFLGTDRYHTPYPNHQALYERTLDYLNQHPNWTTQGWVPETLHYWRTECLST